VCKMIEIKLELISHLKNRYFTNVIEMSYCCSVSVYKLLKDAKIDFADVGTVAMLEGVAVKKDYNVKKSCTIKLYPVFGGG